jgi:galactonate dehydratase
VQPDLAHCGGFGAVALHFDVATPNFVIQEEAVGIVPWFEEICAKYPMARRDGAWAVPEAAGLGIEIDEAAAARHPFAPEQIPSVHANLIDGRVANW